MKYVALLVLLGTLLAVGYMMFVPSDEDATGANDASVGPQAEPADAASGESRPPRRSEPDVSPPPAPEPPAFTEETGPQDTTLRGAVLSPAGNPVREALVTLYKASGTQGLRGGDLVRVKEPVLTHANGEFEIAGISGGKGYAVKVEHGAYAQTLRRDIVVEKHRANEIEDICLSSGVAIHGVVARKSGAGVAGAKVAVFSLVEPSNDPVRQVITGEDGLYRLEGLTPGVFDLAVSAEGLESQRSGPVHVLAAPAVEKRDFVLGEARSIKGRIVAPGGEGVAGAVVRAHLQRGAHPSSGQAASSADGTFEIGGLAEGSYRVEVSRKGYAPDSRLGVAADGAPLRICLIPTAGVTGFVVSSADRNPVKSFGLMLWKLDKDDRRNMLVGEMRLFSSEDGSFTIEDVAAGSYQLQAYAKGLAPAFSKPFAVRDVYVHGVRIRLDPGASIKGTVVDSANQPFAGATVRLLDNAFRELPVSHLLYDKYTKLGKTQSDEQGAFVFDSLAPGTYQVQVSAADRLTQSQRDIVVKPRAETTCGPFVLSEGGHLTGTVLDARQVPSKGAKVSLLSDEEGLLKEVRTNEAGEFSMRNLAPGSYKLAALPGLSGDNPGTVVIAAITSMKAAIQVTVIEGQTVPVTIYLQT
ncbi:MAG: carboxypeptidase regulatory-like domain-containing protein [Planctomycetes bacterium]|nr:carboxypeptidase regulatory-like domain-containing protein [Planctomycetota bacterium]